MRRFFLFAVGLLVCANSFALAGFSRACPWNQVPSSLQGPAARLFTLIGSAPFGKFDGLSSLPANQQARWWVLESLTIDWVSVRYYLYAENRLYWHDDECNTHGTSCAWHYFR